MKGKLFSVQFRAVPISSNETTTGCHGQLSRGMEIPRHERLAYARIPQQRLYFLPEPQGQASFLPTFGPDLTTVR